MRRLIRHLVQLENLREREGFPILGPGEFCHLHKIAGRPRASLQSRAPAAASSNCRTAWSAVDQERNNPHPAVWKLFIEASSQHSEFREWKYSWNAKRAADRHLVDESGFSGRKGKRHQFYLRTAFGYKHDQASRESA